MNNKNVAKRLAWVLSSPNVFVKFVRSVRAAWATQRDLNYAVNQYRDGMKKAWTNLSPVNKKVALEQDQDKRCDGDVFVAEAKSDDEF